MKKLNVMAIATAAALALSACADDPNGEPTPVESSPPEATATPSFDPEADPTEGLEDSPGALVLEEGACYNAGLDGGEVELFDTVPCDQTHNSEVYFSAVIQNGESLGELEQACYDLLEPPYSDIERGEPMALPADPSVIRSPDVLQDGDTVYCVYIHDEAVEGSIDI